MLANLFLNFSVITVAVTWASVQGAEPLSIFMGKMEESPQLARDGRTLLFPFNTQHAGAAKHIHGEHHDDHGHHHNAHHGHHHDDHDLDRLARQNDEADGSGDDSENVVDLGAVAAAGERCVEKVMMVEETEYDEEIECHHSYDERCHTTYTTDYEPQQEEDCDENFVKNCYIEYKTAAFDEPVEICNENLVRNCDKPGPTVCETVYESECATSYHAHEVEEDVPECRIMQVEKCKDVVQGYKTSQQCDKWPKQVCTLETKTVKRYSPETQCEKKPREVCGPGPCPIEAGPEECRQETRTVVQEIPEESCHLSPRKVCKFVTKLVPVLKPKENCVDIPKEVCTRARKNPRTVKRPIIKKWCYTPKPEEVEESSGSGDNDNNNNDGPEPTEAPVEN